MKWLPWFIYAGSFIARFVLRLSCLFAFVIHCAVLAADVALITGITGQDGSYMAEFLLDKGYVVHGVVRRSSTSNTTNIDHLIQDPLLKDRLVLHFADLTDASSIRKVLEVANPDEIYNLAGQTDVRISFDIPVQTSDITGMGVVRILEANRQLGGHAKVYQASTSELFGISHPPQSEVTPFHPRSPYGVAKLYGYWIGVNYRESYGMFVCNGILFNHESPRRGDNFITRKITKAIGQILSGNQEILELGNLDAKRDWGFAPDYIECMWKMLQMDKPTDYVIGTGEQHSVREFVEI
jgi:GDPmannose 4,6-dehydratase